MLSFVLYREFKIRLKRDTELFTDDFVADKSSNFDPAKVLTGDVEGNIIHVAVTVQEYSLQGCALSKMKIGVPSSMFCLKHETFLVAQGE